MPWQTTNLPRNSASLSIIGKLQSQFPPMVAAADFPIDAGIYERDDPGSPTMEIFFTPSAVEIEGPLFAQLGAVDCPEPDRSELTAIFEDARGRAPG
jgi:hypothetical protein